MDVAGTLDDRKAAILSALISHYVRTGEPVGSKTLVDRYNLKISSATARNELAALEEAGMISQPHTSAGRVPTDAGYRFFVNAFASEPRLPSAEAARVRRFFVEPRLELEDALRQTASLLSSLTDQAAVVFAPALDRSVVRAVELVALGEGRAMLVLVTDTGRVENHILSVPDDVDDVQLGHTAQMLNRLIVGAPLDAVDNKIKQGLETFPLELRTVADLVADTVEDALSAREAERVFLEGASTIVDEGKFADLETVRGVIGALEHRRILLEMLADALSVGRVSVRIGSENQMAEMQACAVITAPYGTGPSALGSLGLVGPTRMDYRRSIAAVYEVAANLGRMLSDLDL